MSDSPQAAHTPCPLPTSHTELAQLLGITSKQLTLLASSPRAFKGSGHYMRFEVPKKSGGTRCISAPNELLKQVQQRIALSILSRASAHEAAHGFLPGQSIATNAAAHVGAEVVINVDLEDFFPSITFHRVRGVFAALGCNEMIAPMLATLCTEPFEDERGRTTRAIRRLPQGAPSSPMITNLLCRRLDARMSGLSEVLGMVYTRYADDMTVSCGPQSTQNLGAMLAGIETIVGEEGFRLNPHKTRIQRRGQRQQVTGVVVNKSLSIARETLKRFRALLFQIERDGPQGKYWGEPDAHQDVLASAQGFASFVYMIDPDRGAPLLERVAALGHT